MNIKKRLHDLCLHNSALNNIYCKISSAKYRLRLYVSKKHRKFKMLFHYYKQRVLNPDAVFLVFTPAHDNLGDHAIAVAAQKVLSELNLNYIEITEKDLDALYQMASMKVMNGRPIFINGGGNLGTLWFYFEEIHRKIITDNPKSDVFILPNTIYYENSDWGKQEFEESIRIYNKHKNLYLYAREAESYAIMKNAYTNVKLVPDLVLMLNKCEPHLERNGCLLCLRSDIEKTRSDAEDEILYSQVKSLFNDNIKFTDMGVGHPVGIDQREQELEKKFNEFKSAELVITDRLHGMIFCAITGTPCIVVNSRSHKVKGCYDWIKSLEYIRFADNVSEIVSIYNQIPKKSFDYDNSYLLPYYNELKSDIKKILDRRN